MMHGLTAHYLVNDAHKLKAGETALIHAAAGGVGLLLVQMAHAIGARVIGTVSSDEKAQLAREAGADEVIVFTRQDFETEVKRLTGGNGVDVVYDGVGKDTFEKNLNVMRLRGMLVLYGMSSGAGASGGSGEAIGERIALHGAHQPGSLHRDAGRIAGADPRIVRHDRRGQAQSADCEDVSAGRGGTGASRSGSAARLRGSCCYDRKSLRFEV